MLMCQRAGVVAKSTKTSVPVAAPLLSRQQSRISQTSGAALAISPRARVVRANSFNSQSSEERSSQPSRTNSVNSQDTRISRTSPRSNQGASQGRENSSVKILETKGDVKIYGPPRSQDEDQVRVPRIVCYGDSITAGYYSQGQKFKAYGETLASELADAGTPCEVVVCGLCSFTTQDMLNERSSEVVKTQIGPYGRGIKHMLEEDGPIDLVIIMTGTNDMGTQTSNSTIVQHISQLHAICHDRGIPTVALAPTQSSSRGVRKLRQTLADTIERWAGNTRGVLDYLDVEDVLPRAVGKDGNSKIPAAAQHWEPDDLHLSAAGSVALGRRLARHAASWLKQIADNDQGVLPKAKKPTSPSNPAATPRALSHEEGRKASCANISRPKLQRTVGDRSARSAQVKPLYSARSCGLSLGGVRRQHCSAACGASFTAPIMQLCR